LACFARDPEFQNKATMFWGREYDSSCQDYADTHGVDNIGELCGPLARSAEFVSTPLLVLTSYYDPVIAAIHGCEDTFADLGTKQWQDFKERWINGMKKELDNLRSAKPEIALYVTSCEIHCMTYQYPNMKVEQETINNFISRWLAGDGKTPQHALDRSHDSNPTCPVD